MSGSVPTTAYICPNHPWIRQYEAGTCPIDDVALTAVPIPEIIPAGSVRVPINSDEATIQSYLEAAVAGTATPTMRPRVAQRLLDLLNAGQLRYVSFEKNIVGTPVVSFGDPLVTMPPTLGGGT